jgi:uncharacterized lipoprotein YmbA
VEVPDYLDRPQIVTRKANNELEIDEFERWAGELQKDIGRVLGETMSVALSGCNAAILTGRRLVPADLRITVHILRFEAMPGGVVWLRALWSVFRGEGRQLVFRGESDLAEPVQGQGHEAIVAAMGRAVGRMGVEMAGALRPLLPAHCSRGRS